MLVLYLWLILSGVKVTNAGDGTIIITTKLGKIRGISSSTTIEPCKEKFIFKGVPYAQPPIGDLRFKAPVRVEEWDNIYDATYYRSVCIQSLNATLSKDKKSKVIGSEDCLYLNIYTTKLPCKKSFKKLPIIFWIHGGGFLTLSGDIGDNGADRFLNNDVMVVTLNYRIGVFGFLSTKDLVCPGNFGLKDIYLALKWIKSNIASFGGNPQQVTIMGQGSGGILVHLLILSERAKGLFHGAIAQSGDALMSRIDTFNSKLNALKVGAFNGIVAVSSFDLINKLRYMDAYKLQNSITFPIYLGFFDVSAGFQFGPVIETASPEAMVTGYSYEKLASGAFTNVPFLHGFNSLETRYFKRTASPFYDYYATLDNFVPSQLVPQDMHVNPFNLPLAGTEIRLHYFGDQFIDLNIDEDAVIFSTDDSFVRPIVKSSKLQSQHGPVYFYVVAFTGGLFHYNFEPEGVEFGEELQFLWLTLIGNSSVSTAQRSEEAIQIATLMSRMWANFAKTGNPTPIEDVNVDERWPVVNFRYDENFYYARFGKIFEIRTNPRQEHMVFWDKMYKRYGHGPYNTY